MKKSAFISIAIFSSIVVSFASSFAIFGLALNPVYGDTYLGELKYKVQMLKDESNKKRIIMTGGSAIPFAIDSSLIEEHLPSYDVVDFGLYAGLGSNLMIDIVKEEVRSGDIVILSLEQNRQMLSKYFNAENTLQAMDGDISLLKYVSPEYYGSLLADFPTFAINKLRYNISPLSLGSIYQRSSFNDEGDIKKELRENNIMGTLYDETQSVSFSTDLIDDEFVSYLNEFNKTVEDKGASVYYYFPPINELSLEGESSSKIDDFYDELSQKLEFEIIGNPHNSIMDPLWFYDTNFHLNGSGATVYTKQLIQDLKVLFKDTTKTDIELPPVPEAEVNEVEGDNVDGDKFRYEYAKGKPIISELIDKDIDSVIVPYSYEDQIIRSFEKTAFNGCDKLEKIVIQENITTISDDSFAKCKNLKGIYLKQTSPNRIKIADGLLNGTSANIYVPESSLGSYLTDYNFSKFAKRIYSY